MKKKLKKEKAFETIVYIFFAFIILIYENYSHKSKEIKFKPLDSPSIEKEEIIDKCIDGDTIEINAERIRIIGLDAFETMENNRAYYQVGKYNMTIEEIIEKGIKAKELCQKYWEGQKVTIKRWKYDSYGRTLANVSKDGLEYSDFMIEKGVAVYLKKY